MRSTMPLTSPRPPSAVRTMLSAFEVLRSATEKLRMRDFKDSLTPNPAASSAA